MYCKKYIPCRKFVEGFCPRGNSCNHSHDLIAKELLNTEFGDNAPEFVPTNKFYEMRKALFENITCPLEPPCPLVDCVYGKHLELCEMCDLYCLDPKDKEKRCEHIRECVRQHEEAMNLSFAIADSKEKLCGICLEFVVTKEGHEKRFGILSNCNHVFCLVCIRKWRRTTSYGRNGKCCPECRVQSEFVCPNSFWVNTKDEKDELFKNYINAMGSQHCKYFKSGLGVCHFGKNCFYKHEPAAWVLNKCKEEVPREVEVQTYRIGCWISVSRHNADAVDMIEFAVDS